MTASEAQDSIVRGQQIIPQLEKLHTTSGAQRFNLIGHSQGAMDARYIAAVRPDLVTSVSSVSGPHAGSPVADAVLGFPLGLGTAGIQGIAELLNGADGAVDVQAHLVRRRGETTGTTSCDAS